MLSPSRKNPPALDKSPRLRFTSRYPFTTSSDLLGEVKHLENEFFTQPWMGAKFILVESSRSFMYVFETQQTRVSGPEDLQSIAAMYRELENKFNTTIASCIINVNAIPKMPGNVGYIFGYQALYTLTRQGSLCDISKVSYDDSNGAPEIIESESSAMKTAWEERIGEPLEHFIKRLFVPIVV